MLAKARGALVAIQARDFERAVTFYTAVLGLSTTFRHEDYWVELRAPGLTLGISSAGDATVVGGGSTTVCFEVASIDTVIEGLRSRGVSFVGPVVEKFHGKEAYFTDSEGNPLMLHQSTMASPAESAKAAATKRPAARAGAKKSPSGGPARVATRRTTANAKGRKAASRRGRGKKGKR